MKISKQKQIEIDILRLIHHYSMNNKLVDEDFILKMMDIIVNKKELKKEIRNIDIEEVSPAGNEYRINPATYDYKEKKVIAYLQDINRDIQLIDKKTPFLNKIEKVFAKNLEITRILLHEVEHANQHKKVDSNYHTLETDLLRISFKHSQENQNMFHEKYIYAPSERIAEIDAAENIKKIITPLKESLPTLVEYENVFVLQKRIQGYERKIYGLEAPTCNFLFSFENLHSFDFYDQNYPKMIENISKKYTTPKILRLGLPIDYEEFANTEKKLYKKIDFLNKNRT